MTAFLTVELAWKDLRYEAALFATQVLALAAVIAPLLILYSLKVGVIDTLLADLVDDPANRRVIPVRQGTYTADFFKVLRADPDVDFIVPNASPIARRFEFTQAGRALPRSERAIGLASAAGDPLLPVGAAPPGDGETVVTRRLARSLDLETGDTLIMSASRQYGPDAIFQSVSLPLKISGIVGDDVWDDAGVLVSLTVLTAFEQWRDFYAVPNFGWGGDEPLSEPVYYSFRLYAADLASMRRLIEMLQAQGVEARAPRLAAYERIVILGRGLDFVFLVVAGAAGTGYVLAFSANLWGAVQRKRHALSLLRLAGLGKAATGLFPMVQASVIAVGGWLVGVAIYIAGSVVLTSRLGEVFTIDSQLTILAWTELLAALGLTLGVALGAAFLAARQAMIVDPAEGVRHG